MRAPCTRWPTKHGEPLVLPATHVAVIEDRPLFKDQVFDAAEVDRVLIPAENNSKLGSHWTKGPWLRAPLYTLTLPERMTCPGSCPVRDACMGNHMHWSKRLIVNDNLYAKLDAEVRLLSALYKRFTVRLHQLGDFADERYTRFWIEQVRTTPELAVFGFTAHLKSSRIGSLLNAESDHWDRFRVRFSAETGDRSTTVMVDPKAGSHAAGITCPVEAAPPRRDGEPRELKCGSCGLCLTSRKPIVFKLH